MTAREMARMTEWLKSFGLTAEQIDELLNFIAYGNGKKETPNRNKEKTE